MVRYLQKTVFHLREFQWRDFLIFLLIISALAIILISGAISNHKTSVRNSTDFQKLAEIDAGRIRRYSDYCKYGIRLLFLPSPTVALFDSNCSSSEKIGRVNSVRVLDILENKKGAGIFEEDTIFPSNFKYLILLFGSVFVFYLGYTLLRDPPSLRFYLSVSSAREFYFSILTSRLVIISVFVITVAGAAWLTFLINGISLDGPSLRSLAGYLLSIELTLFFLFLLSHLLSFTRSKKNCLLVLATSWLLFVQIIPGFIGSIAMKEAAKLPSYFESETAKQEIMNDFEEYAIKQYGEYLNLPSEIRIKVINDFWKNWFPKIMKVERDFRKDITRQIDEHFDRAALSPVSMHLAVCREVSGDGFLSYMDFFDYLYRLRENFTCFFIQKVYIEEADKVVGYIKGDMNLFRAVPGLPPTYWKGILYTLAYCLILMAPAYYFFIRTVFPTSRVKVDYSTVDLPLENGKHYRLYVFSDGLKDNFYKILNGKVDGFNGRISIDGENIVTQDKKDFLFLPALDQLPMEIKTGKLLAFLKASWNLDEAAFSGLASELGDEKLDTRLKKFPMREQLEIILKIFAVASPKVLLMDDFLKSIPGNHHAEVRALTQELFRDNPTILLDMATTNLPAVQTTERYQFHKDQNNVCQMSKD